MSTTRHKYQPDPFDLVIAVGSLGALQSFNEMLAVISPPFPAAIVFDLHRGNSDGLTQHILARRCALPVRPATQGLALEPSTIYLAPPNRQLLIDDERHFGISDSDEVVGHRFADALLVSAARVHGPRLMAVVLSGRLEAGARGVREVKRQGGRVMVQDPSTTVTPGMPNAALATGCVDFALSPAALGHALVAMCAAAGAAELFRVRLNAAVAG